MQITSDKVKVVRDNLKKKKQEIDRKVMRTTVVETCNLR